MKAIRLFSVAILLMIFVSKNAFSQGNYSLEVEQQVEGSNLLMDLFIHKIDGADFALSSCNFAVIIDTSALSLAGVTKDASLDGPWDNGANSTSYLDIFVGKGSNFFNVNVLRRTNGPGSGHLVTSTRTRIARVIIPIKDSCVANSSQWVVKPAAQNMWPLVDIKPYANFVNPAPFPLCKAPNVPFITAVGNDTICEGNTTMLSTNYNGDIQWYKDGVVISGANSADFDATEAGVYTVEAVNCLCKTMSLDSFNLIVKPLPVKPNLALVGNTLITDGTGTLRWYKDGKLIEGVSDVNYIPTTSGLYTVEAVNDCGTKTSDAVEVIISDVVEPLTSKFEAYPNPYIGETTVSYTMLEAANVAIDVYNALGQKMASAVNQYQAPGNYNFRFGAANYGLPVGVYMLKLRIGDKEKVLKLVELK